MYQSHQKVNITLKSWTWENEKSRQAEKQAAGGDGEVEEGRLHINMPLKGAISASDKLSLLFNQIWRHKKSKYTRFVFFLFFSLFFSLPFPLSGFIIWHFVLLPLLLPFTGSAANWVWMSSKSCSSAARDTSNSFGQWFCLVNYYQYTHTQMQNALSGSLSEAFGTCAVVPSLSRDE